MASSGTEIVRMGNFEIAIDESDAANLRRLYTDAAYLRTVGGVEQYQRFAAGKALMGAGEGLARGNGAAGGEAATGLLGGAGLGVGIGLAQMLVRDPRGGEMLAPAAPGIVCPACIATVPPGRYCSSCGVELRSPEEATRSSTAFCAGCASPLAPDAHFCGQCGRAREGS